MKEKINYLSYDLETRGLPADIERNKIWMAGFIHNGKAPVIVSNPNGMVRGNIPTYLLELLEDEDTVKIIHSSEFDAPLSELFFNTRVRNIWDTKIAEQIILGLALPRSEKDEEVRKLYSASLAHTLYRYGLGTLDKNVRENFIDRPDDIPFTKEENKYLTKDINKLYKLMMLQKARIAELELEAVAEMEMIVCEAVANFRTWGVQFDAGIWEANVKEDEKELAKLQKALEAKAKKSNSIAPTNWNSPPQVKKFFQGFRLPLKSFKEMEIVLRDFNPKEQGWQRDDIKQAEQGLKLLHDFTYVRELSQRIAKYGYDWVKRFQQHDGRIRASFQQIVNTSRFQIEQPNLSQLPKESKRREAFIAARGHVLIDADFDGQEMGIMAAASGERELIDFLLAGGDPHARAAMQTFPNEWDKATLKGCTYPKKCKCPGHGVLRQNGKILNFMLAYGGGAPKYAHDVGCTEHEARVIIRKFKNTIRHLNWWLSQNGKESMMTGVSYSASPLKRRRVLYSDISWHLRNQGMNNPVQAAGADMLKRAIVTLHKQGWKIILPWHDQLFLEVKKADAKKACKALKAAMEEAADWVTGIEGLVTVSPRITHNMAKG